MQFRGLLFVFLAGFCACAEAMPEHVALLPQGEGVEFASEPPSKNSYRLLGEVTGQAESKDVDIAQQGARNDLRNKAAALGATLVTIDEDLGEPVFLLDRTRVKLTGRAYAAAD